MRALSVKQPYAELIAEGEKKIEYRRWKVNVRGDLLVVASASRQDDVCADARLDPEKLVYGAAVCVVDVWKITGDEGRYKWHLRNPRRVEPEPIKGSASIYHVDDSRIRFTKRSPRLSELRARSKKRTAIVRVAGKPNVVLAMRDARRAKQWQATLGAMGCHVEVFGNGYVAWQRLASAPAVCVVLDAEVQGYPAAFVIARMRESKTHAATPVIISGRADVPRDPRVVRVARSAGEEDVVRAVARALGDRVAGRSRPA